MHRSTLLAEVYHPVPAPTTLTADAQIMGLQFSAEQRFQLRDDLSADAPWLLTSGVAHCRCSWSSPPQLEMLGAPSTVVQPEAHGGAGSAAQRPNLLQVPMPTDRKKPEPASDPNDPRSAQLLQSHKSQARAGDVARRGHFFRLGLADAEFGESPTPKRDELLRLRHQEVVELRGKTVPAFDQEIPAALMRDPTARELEREPQFQDFRQTAVATFLSDVRAKQIAAQRAAQHALTLPQVVNEEALPDMSTLGRAIK
mgnify:CR=1 FL=1